MDYGWVGGSGDFTDPDQWFGNNGTPPGDPPPPEMIAFYTNDGDVSFSGNTNYGADVEAAMTFDLTAGSYTLTATETGGPGGLDVTSPGALTVTGGQLTTTNFSDSAEMTIDNATVEVTDAILLAAAGGVGGVLTMEDGSVLTVDDGSTGGRFVDAGLIALSDGLIVVPYFVNIGVLDVAAGGSFVSGLAGDQVGSAKDLEGTVDVAGGLFHELGSLLMFYADVTLESAGVMQIDGELEQLGGNLLVEGGATLLTGDFEPTATFSVLSGGTVWANDVDLAGPYNGSTIDATVSGAGSRLHAETLGVGGGVAILAAGAELDAATFQVTFGGTLEIDQGGRAVDAGSLMIGEGQQATSTVEVAGGGTLEVGADLVVGDSGAGAFILDAGAMLQLAGALIIGAQSGGSGAVTLDAGASLDIAADITIGSQGTGALVLDGSSTLTGDGTLIVGDGPGSLVLTGAAILNEAAAYIGLHGGSGTVTANGATLAVSGDTEIGFDNASTGFLDIVGTGGLVSTGTLTEGDQSGGTGFAQVSGGGLSVGGGAGTVTVGQAGTGGLIIGMGGSAMAGVVVLGEEQSGVGLADVNGGTLTIGDSLTIGASGTGALVVEDGGHVVGGGALAVDVGAGAGGMGTIIVDGASSLLMAATIAVGGSAAPAIGSSDLTVSNGGLVLATSDAVTSGNLIVLAGGTFAAGMMALGGTVSGYGTLSGHLADDQGELAVIGGTLVLSGDVTGSGDVFVLSTGTLVLAGGTQDTSNGVIAAGGEELVTSGGTALHLQVQSSANLDVMSGTVVSTQVSGGSKNNGGADHVQNGGTATYTMLSGTNSSEVVNQGGSSFFATVSSGSMEQVLGGFTSGATLYYGGREHLEYGGTSIGTQVTAIGGEAVDSGATAISTTIRDAGTLFVAGGAVVTDTVLSIGGVVELIDLAYAGNQTATLDGNNLLTVTEGGSSTTLQLGGNYNSMAFSLAPAPGGDTQVTLVSTPCYVRGTAILTERGEIRIEDLRIGDRVRTVFRGPSAIRWVGHRRLDCRKHRDPETVLPVRVAAGAVTRDLPRRELFLSPDHAVFIDDVLIPIKHLINGRSIAQVAVDAVDYFHVELAAHDVLFAEGLPAESYLDTGNRASFANGAAHVSLHPDFAARSWHDACAALLQSGPLLIAVKQRLFERAGTPPAPISQFQAMTDRRLLVPERLAPDLWAFAVPRGADWLDLVSPTWMPAACHAASLDRRRLGVRVFALIADGVPIDLAAAAVHGFHPPETTAEGGCRWTDGRGRLALPAATRRIVLRIGDGATPGVQTLPVGATPM